MGSRKIDMLRRDQHVDIMHELAREVERIRMQRLFVMDKGAMGESEYNRIKADYEANAWRRQAR